MSFQDLVTMRDFSCPVKDCFLNQPAAGPTRNYTVPDVALRGPQGLVQKILMGKLLCNNIHNTIGFKAVIVDSKVNQCMTRNFKKDSSLKSDNKKKKKEKKPHKT